ncbi:ATP-dependent helicase [Pigmentibacter ruber]
MQNIINSLNKEQKDAVTNIQGACLVLAGAGTGKTKVITSRIAWMIHSGIKPEKIVAVSFTNKAAKEMRDRLGLLVGEKCAKKVELSTFHSFALKILRQFHSEFNLQKNFSICDENESANLIKDSIKEFNLEEIISYENAAQKISEYKDKLFSDEEFKKQNNVFDSKIFCKLFNSYNRRLRLYNLIDFDDIVYLTVLGLRNNADLLNEIQEKFTYLMVDEYQDTSYSQFQLICMLSEKNQNICVVGDDDQSIYSWRGARPSIIADFLKKYPAARKITLEQNYRCSPNILNAANSVIRENTERLGKELWSEQPNLHPIIIHACENERDEALFVSDSILDLKKNILNFTFENIAVLVRSNSQTLSIEQVFIEKDIPYVVHGGAQFFDRKEVKDVLSYLKLAYNINDLNSLFRIMNLPSRGVGIGTLEKIKASFLHEKKLNSNCSLIEILQKFSFENKGIKDFLSKWKIYGFHLNSAKNKIEISQKLKDCFEHMGLKNEILLTSNNMQTAQFRINVVERVFQVIEKLDLEDESISAVVDALHLDKARYDVAKENKNKVQIMTIHSSKGLEFPNVFLIGVEDGILPHEKSMNLESGIQEERRLFYVAITRAKFRLFISYCGFRKKGKAAGKDVEPKPSRFLSAIPKQLVIKEKTDPNSEESKRMDAARKLFELFR